jgi:hypothetical protein
MTIFLFFLDFRVFSNGASSPIRREVSLLLVTPIYFDEDHTWSSSLRSSLVLVLLFRTYCHPPQLFFVSSYRAIAMNDGERWIRKNEEGGRRSLLQFYFRISQQENHQKLYKIADLRAQIRTQISLMRSKSDKCYCTWVVHSHLHIRRIMKRIRLFAPEPMVQLAVAYSSKLRLHLFFTGVKPPVMVL